MNFRGILALIWVIAILAGCAGIDVSEESHIETDLSKSLKFKHLSDLSATDIEKMRPYVKNGEAYAIVHPSWYLFFHQKPFQITPGKEDNVVETFLKSSTIENTPVIQLMKAYERIEMNFISSAKKNGNLVILILPGGYPEAKNYLYKNGADEYSRYLNETVGNSDAVVYIQTKNVSSGKTIKSEQEYLLAFLRKMGIRKILVGGGYVGRCQKEFYKFLAASWPSSEIAIVPEISSFSPNDVSDSAAKMLLTPEMELNAWAANYFIRNGIMKKKDITIGELSTDSSDANLSGPLDVDNLPQADF